MEIPAPSLPRWHTTHVKFDRNALFDHMIRPLIAVSSNGRETSIYRMEPMTESPVLFYVPKGCKERAQAISILESFTNGEMLLGYSNGVLESCSSRTLDVIDSIQISCKSEPMQDSKRMKGEDAQKIAIEAVDVSLGRPLSMASSPNGTAFCVAEWNSGLRYFVRTSPLESGGSMNQMQLGKALADLFERCTLTQASNWDLLLYFRDTCNRSTEQFLFSVLPWLLSDYQSLDVESKQALHIPFQIILSQLLRVSKNHQIGYLDCQSRLLVAYVHSTFTKFLHVVSTSVGKPLNYK